MLYVGAVLYIALLMVKDMLRLHQYISFTSVIYMMVEGMSHLHQFLHFMSTLLYILHYLMVEAK